MSNLFASFIDENCLPLSIIVCLCLIALVLLQHFSYKKILRLYKEEIERLNREKSDLVKQLLDKP